jgi:putative drug exporter of the RND superfamily
LRCCWRWIWRYGAGPRLPRRPPLEALDYEVFLLSRIKEAYNRTGDNQAAVAVGLERTGRIVTAAAALLGVVFLALASSAISFLKMFGVGMALAVVVDATLIRAALVPAFMRLAGTANWWAPGPLGRLHGRLGLREREEPAAGTTLSVEAAEPYAKDVA